MIEVLKKYVTGAGKDWDLTLPLVLMALRSTQHSSTKLSPYEIMTGRQMVMPYHLAFAAPGVTEGEEPPYQYVATLQESLRQVFAFVRRNLGSAASVRKTYYDLFAAHKEYSVGDKVYYFNFTRKKARAKKFLPC